LPGRKRELRDEDKTLRDQIAASLIKKRWENKTARQLASWDPYDQNASSSFFDPEWMFDIRDGFDIVIGNPPYQLIGADKPQEQKIYKHNYKMESYKINTYVLFLEKGLALLKSKDATLSYIIPKSLVFNTYLKQTRNILLSKFVIPQITEIVGKVFENAEVGDNIIFFAQTSNKPLENILVYNTVKNVTPFCVIENYFNEQKLLINDYDSNFHNKLTISTDSKTSLNDVAYVSNGLNPGNVRHILLSSSKESDKHKKMLLGKNIKRYGIEWSGIWVNYDINLKKSLSLSDVKSKKGMTAQKKVDFALRKEKIFYPNKIVVRKTSDHIIASYDSDGFYFDSLSYGIHLKEDVKISILYLLGLLNSKYINYIHESLSLNKGKAFAKVLLKNLTKLPVYEINFTNERETATHDNIVKLVHIIIRLNNSENNIKLPLFDQIIDGMIFELYFPDHMKEKEIDILKFVEQDLKEILDEDDFEQLPDEQKENVIEKLHKRWSDPASEIVKRMNSFAEKSPDILKPILESKQNSFHCP